MAQAELFDIDSPCISVCEMDDKGYCKGCLRNRTERQLWHAMNDEQKRQVLRLLFVRRHKQKITLAKLAKQAIFGEDTTVFSQMTFLENVENVENTVTRNDLATQDFAKEYDVKSLVIESVEKILSEKTLSEKVFSEQAKPVQNFPSNAIANSTSLPETPIKKSNNTSDIKEQNWDFFAVLEESLLPQ